MEEHFPGTHLNTEQYAVAAYRNLRLNPVAGLLLPQVATEYGWDRDTFLDQTCVKAGLPPGAWRARETRIEKFAAEVFGE